VVIIVNSSKYGGSGGQIAVFSQITPTSPAPNASETVDIQVTTNAGTSEITPDDQFTYE